MIDIFCPHCGFELTEAEVRRWIASLNGRRPKKREKELVEPAWIPGPICKCGRKKECGPAAKRCQTCDGAYTLNDPSTDLGYATARPERPPMRHMASMLCKHQRPKHLCLACERGRK